MPFLSFQVILKNVDCLLQCNTVWHELHNRQWAFLGISLVWLTLSIALFFLSPPRSPNTPRSPRRRPLLVENRTNRTIGPVSFSGSISVQDHPWATLQMEQARLLCRDALGEARFDGRQLTVWVTRKIMNHLPAPRQKGCLHQPQWRQFRKHLYCYVKITFTP